MDSIKCILFDCMETIIDVKVKPDLKMYASFAYKGSVCEKLWGSLSEFTQDYRAARMEVDKRKRRKNPYMEYSIFKRFSYMLKKKLSCSDEGAYFRYLSDISDNYRKNYKDNCYVSKDTKGTLEKLKNSYTLGIVSNFMVRGGIEELLSLFGLYYLFDFTVTSIDIGYRKPHDAIYRKALGLSGYKKKEILFVGDNMECDYKGPYKFGFNPVLLDKENKYKHINNRICCISDILKSKYII